MMVLGLLASNSATAQESTTEAPITPAARLQAARDAFQTKNCPEVKRNLNMVLYPKPLLSQIDDLIEAHTLLGVCHFLGKNQLAARSEFEQALGLDSNLTLDRKLFSVDAVEFFDSVKKEKQEAEAKTAELRRVAEERDRLRKALENLVVIEKRPYYINFVPFGAGQFQNGHTRKGILFFSGELAFGGTSAGIFVYHG